MQCVDARAPAYALPPMQQPKQPSSSQAVTNNGRSSITAAMNKHHSASTDKMNLCRAAAAHKPPHLARHIEKGMSY